MQSGTMMLIGTATFAIITLPICINSAAENSFKERVSVNHVPQNTPVKRNSKNKAIKLILIFIIIEFLFM